ncbi:hypothetical protein AB4Y42_02430 [Paraburkholderia sp. EG286B]|uniref:hypothetical protein n=1 Tax=Paraburkholderia sp. EG286B TaxID=3237011 RepID=UPI0034D29D42
MATKQLSDKLLTKLRELSEKPEGWGDIRIIEPADARSILAALATSDAAVPIKICFGESAQLSTETADKPVQRMSDAERDVHAERARQVTVEGWTPIHDDHHDLGQLASAGACYALAHRWARRDSPPQPGDWNHAWWKPTSWRRDLVKAGALIIAEIERIDRAGSADAQNGAHP